MPNDISEVIATAKKRTQEVEERKELQRQARLLKTRAQELKAKQEAQEKMVAPVFLILTIIISAMVMLLSNLGQ